MHQDIIKFCFEEIDSSYWWKKDPEFDKEITQRFGALLDQARNCELFSWRNTTLGRLAEIFILDQFSRNIFRDTPQAFSQDALALCLAQEAVQLEFDKELSESQRAFLYMPYMHSESKTIHIEAVKLFEQLDNKYNYEFELRHKAIIDQFGRYPHRNQILGRKSSPEEIAFLKTPNSSF